MALPRHEKKWIDKSIGVLSVLIEIAEVAIAVAMMFLIFMGLAYLFRVFARGLGDHLFLNSAEIHHHLDVVLTLFIVIELVRITFAYLTGQKIWAIVAETAFIALGRKIILFEYESYGLMGAISLAILTIVVVLAYYVVRQPKTAGKAMKESSS